MSDQDFAEAVELATELAEERSLHQQTMAERDRLRAEVERLQALLEPSVTMTSPHVTDPGNANEPPTEVRGSGTHPLAEP
jgi:hypothetical protein